MQSKLPVKRALPIIRVFVSSTFSDLKHERNALHAKVWPELERYCQQRGFTFQAIDLRWGVPAEAGLDHRTMRICFEELRRAQETSPEPNFLILLGNRYGWRPLPEVISVDEFAKLKTAAEQIQGEPPDVAKQLTEKQVELLKKAVAVLEDWYLLDENAKPLGEQTPIGEYVLRSRKTSRDGVDYGRQPDATGKLRDTDAWVDVQFVLWSIVNRAFPVAELAERFQAQRETSPGIFPSSVRFQASATEQEIWQGALQVANADRHVIAAVRKIDDLDAIPDTPRRGDFIDLKDDGTPDGDARKALIDLKTELEGLLGKTKIIRSMCQWATDQDNNPTGDVTTSHLDDLCREILDRFKSIIIEQINAYWGCDLSADDATLAQVRGSQQELDLECADHLRFASERAPEKTFVGRESELQWIRDYLHSETNQPFVVHGPSGSGKTALLGRIIQEVTPPRSADGTRAKTGPIVLTRFIGTTPESSNLRSLLSSLCRELRPDFEVTTPLPTDLNKLIDEFYSQLGKANAARPVFVFLDALDQLDAADHGRSVFWIRSPLPSTTDASCHARMVVSSLSPSDEFLEDSDTCEPFRELKLRTLLGDHELGALDENEARELFANWLDDAKRRVSEPQQDMIWAVLQKSPACRQPLFLKVLFEEAKLWRSFDADVQLNEPETSNDYVGALLKQLFDRLSLEVNHGKLLVERALGYIAAARCGLSETEILEVLFADRDFRRSIVRTSLANKHRMSRRPRRIPIAIWSRLRSDLAPYLTERAAPGGEVLTLYHRQVAEWVKSEYASHATWNPHGRLAEFFAKQDYFLEPLERQHAPAGQFHLQRTSFDSSEANVRRQLPNHRKLTELLYQLTSARSWSGLQSQLNVPLIEATFWADYLPETKAPFVVGERGIGLERDIRAAFEAITDEAEAHRDHPQVKELILRLLTFVEEHAAFFAVYPHAVHPQLSVAARTGRAADISTALRRLLLDSPAVTLSCSTSTLGLSTSGHGQLVRWMLPLNDNEFVSIAGNEPFAVWRSWPPHRCRLYHPLPEKEITAVASLPQRGRILAASADGTLSYSSAHDGDLLFQSALPERMPSCATLIDDRRALIGTERGLLFLIDLLTGSSQRVSIQIDEPLIYASAWNKGFVLLATPTRVMMLSLHSSTMHTTSAKVLLAIESRLISVAACGVDCGHRVWLIGTTDGTVMEGNEFGRTGSIRVCSGEQIRSLCFLPDRSFLVCPAYSPPKRIVRPAPSGSRFNPDTWLGRLRSPRSGEQVEGVDQPVNAVVVLKNGTTAFGTAKGDVIICGNDHGNRYVARRVDLYTSAAVSVGTATAILGTEDGFVESRNVDNGERVWSARVGDSPVTSISVDSRSRTVAAASLIGMVTVLDLATGQLLACIDQLKGLVHFHKLAFNPVTGDLYVAAYASHIYRIRSGDYGIEELYNGRLKEGAFLRCDHSGRFLLVGCETHGHLHLADLADGGFKLKDLRVSALTAIFASHSFQIFAFNSEGVMALSRSGEADSPKPIRSAAIRQAETIRGGSAVAIVDEDGTLSVIDVESARTISAARLDGAALALLVDGSNRIVCVTRPGTLYQFSYSGGSTLHE